VRWTVCREFAVDIQALDGEYVAYHHGSGCTHCLSAEAGELFISLSNAPVASDLEGLMMGAGLTGPEQLQTMLEQLTALSLITVSEST